MLKVVQEIYACGFISLIEKLLNGVHKLYEIGTSW